MMKVIRTDNYARETVADQLIHDGLSREAAEKMADELNAENRDDSWFYRAVADGYRLSRGMEDFV